MIQTFTFRLFKFQITHSETSFYSSRYEDKEYVWKHMIDYILCSTISRYVSIDWLTLSGISDIQYKFECIRHWNNNIISNFSLFGDRWYYKMENMFCTKWHSRITDFILLTTLLIRIDYNYNRKSCYCLFFTRFFIFSCFKVTIWSKLRHVKFEKIRNFIKASMYILYTYKKNFSYSWYSLFTKSRMHPDTT